MRKKYYSKDSSLSGGGAFDQFGRRNKGKRTLSKVNGQMIRAAIYCRCSTEEESCKWENKNLGSKRTISKIKFIC